MTASGGSRPPGTDSAAGGCALFLLIAFIGLLIAIDLAA